ncbi:hypothetical protein F5Y03DRAFT_383282 [Xylaria venustula]|nr:hypothetical protein F5Y03DRAFT_383282 [Xylaria venustula]
MVSQIMPRNAGDYNSLPESDGGLDDGFDKLIFIVCIVSSAAIGLSAGVLGTIALSSRKDSCQIGGPQRIPLSTIKRTFTYSSPFSQVPPQGNNSGTEDEPIWDTLVPNGLGYFKDSILAPNLSIPTVIHQLHCLYVIRRAYYSQSADLQDFDFNEDRSIHLPHCFDYLRQGIICSADTTVEDAINVADSNGFPGSGFARTCYDYDALKEFLSTRRAFDATGFLAHGLDHGIVHFNST